MASSANHTCLAQELLCGAVESKELQPGHTLPWQESHLESFHCMHGTSLSPTAKRWTGSAYVLLRMVESAGHRMEMLWREAWWFTQLKALVASTNRTASQSLSSSWHGLQLHSQQTVLHKFALDQRPTQYRLQ